MTSPPKSLTISTANPPPSFLTHSFTNSLTRARTQIVGESFYQSRAASVIEEMQAKDCLEDLGGAKVSCDRVMVKVRMIASASRS